MASTAATVSSPSDSPEARRYNRIRRWLGIFDFILGLSLMVALLATGWSGTLRDIAYKASFQHYSVALFFYVLMIMLLSKVLGLGLDYYGFRLEHRYQLIQPAPAGVDMGRGQRLSGGTDPGRNRGRAALLHHAPGAGALVADCVGGISGTVRAAGATGAGDPVSYLL